MSREKTRILAQLARHRETAPWRFWGIVGLAGISLSGMVAAVAPGSLELDATRPTVVEAIELPNPTPLDAGSMALVREERLQRGETLAALLERLGISDPQALTYLRGNREASALVRALQPGRLVTARMDERGRLLGLAVPTSGDSENTLLVERTEDGSFAVRTQKLALETRVLMKSARISSSLFAATDDADVPDGVAAQLAEIFAGEIDFHRELRRGDHFSVVYEVVYAQGRPLRSGRVLAARFVNRGESYEAFWHTDAQGVAGYFDEYGKSLRKAFLRSPIEFSRISSGFSNARFHPVLQEWRAHKGVDYAAPVGTRVRATADGVVEFIGRQGGYGNLIVLRHRDRYSTHYGHLNGFASGLRKGSRIEQGAVIGYVGQTGLATGPHLHYEFRIDGVHQDPLRVVMPQALPLEGRALVQFRDQTGDLTTRLALARPEDRSTD